MVNKNTVINYISLAFIIIVTSIISAIFLGFFETTPKIDTDNTNQIAMEKLNITLPNEQPGIYRFEDVSKNATCWYAKDGFGTWTGSLSCVANSQLR